MTRTRRIILAACSLGCALALLSTTPALAAVLDGDIIGGVKVADAPRLRAPGVAPDLYVPAGVLSTMQGRILWARDPESQRAMASTTKIMTAVVVLEHGNLDDVITVDRLAASVGQSSMRLRVGEKITERELLKGVLVQSGNDAATLIAEHVGGTVPDFVKMMNAEAARLNLVNTHYVNPHGLDAPGHYTSADDLTTLARYAMTFPLFREIVRHHSLTVHSNKYTHVLISQNVLLLKYKGTEGIKTGWTNNAGYCVVVAAKRGPIELIGTIMGTNTEPGRAQQAKALLNWGFNNYRESRIATAGAVLGRVPVSDYMERTVAAVTADTSSTAVFGLAGPLSRRVVLDPGVAAPVRKGQVLGTVMVVQGTSLLAQLPLTAAASVPAPSAWQRVQFFFGRIWRSVFG